MADIKERIRKVLALASSPHEEEAKAALLKAKELMAKYKLTEADFDELKKQELVHLACPNVAWTTDSGYVWMAALCDELCKNYCCVAAWCTPRGTRTHILEITGMEQDADLCKQVIEYAVGFIFGQIHYLQRKYVRQDPKAIANSYAKGFITGLILAFEEQQEEHPEWGLVVVKPEEVQNYEDTLRPKTVRTRGSEFDPLAHTRGLNDGKNFNAKRVIQ